MMPGARSFLFIMRRYALLCFSKQAKFAEFPSQAVG